MDAIVHNTFALYLAAGAGLGLAWSWQRVYAGNPHRMSSQQHEAYLQFLLLGGLAMLAGGLAGARLGYVFLHWGYYSIHTAEILQLSAGGLDWGGSLPGAAIGLFFVCGLTDRSPTPLLADLLPLFSALFTALWLSAPAAGVYYGQVHEPAWWTTTVRDQMSELHVRVPLALGGALLAVGWGAAADLLLPVRLTAVRFECFAIGQLLILLAASFLRADPVAPLLGLPADRVFVVGYLIIFTFMAAWRVRIYRKRVVLA